MCGFAGLLNVNGHVADPMNVRRMAGRLAHRGPDGEGVWAEGPVALGHRRLAIIDLSAAAQQPMTSRDGRFVIIYNGEIYNFLELRKEAEALGVVFRTSSDTEILLEGYALWGPELISRLNGMFAFAIWDRAEHRLTLARDRYGIKPLYIWSGDGCVLFASEIKAFLEHPSFRVRVDELALQEYFTFQNLFSERTLFAGVQLVPPATRVIFERGRESRTVYWKPDFREPERTADIEEEDEELSRLFRQAVRRQLVADVPVGTYLSSGMDSGGIASEAAASLPGMPSFTCGFDMDSVSGLEVAFDERDRARTLSNWCGTRYHEVVLKSGDMTRVLPKLVWHLEDLRVGQCYPNFYTAELASQNVKVVLSGSGGDELFAGYPWRYYRAVNNASYADYVDKYYTYWQRLVPNRVIQKLFREPVWNKVRKEQTVDIFRSVIGSDPRLPGSPEEYVNRSLTFEFKTFLHGLLVVEDRLSMAHGLETRLPFLDNDLVDYAMRISVHRKLRDLNEVVRLDEDEPGDKSRKYFAQTNDGKLILRKMLSRCMPPGFTDGVKQGFSGPDATWFRGQSIDFVREKLLTPDAAIYRFLNPQTLEPLINEHLNGLKNQRLLIWSLLCFEEWCRIFLDGNVPEAVALREAGNEA